MSRIDMLPMPTACLRPIPSGTLLVFADDWGRHPSSAQHLIKWLLKRHQVIWVNTIGMRPPRLNLHTAQRAARKFVQWIAPQPQTIVDNPRILNPRMWPWLRSSWEQRLNARLLARQISPTLSNASQPAVGLTTVPFTAGLIGKLAIERWVYYCVDEFAEWPGHDRRSLLELERQLLDRVDDVITVSPALQERVQRAGRSSTLLTHGVDVSHWKANNGDTASNVLEKYPRPRIVFWGLIDDRLDTEFLEVLDRRMTGGSIVLVGPCEVNPLRPEHRHLHLHGVCNYNDLPSIAREADVLVMPYRDIPVTRAMQPLKLLEYLSTDRPVVAQALPTTQQYFDSLDVAANAEEFAAQVMHRVVTGLPADQHSARQRITSDDWSRKAEHLDQLLFTDECFNPDAGFINE